MKNNPKEKGIILISAFLLISILIISGIAIFSQSLHESVLSRRHSVKIKAYYIARAGMAKTTIDIYEAFRNDPNGWNPTLGIASFDWFVNELPGRSDLFPSRVRLNELLVNESSSTGMFTVALAQTKRPDEAAAGVCLTSGGAILRLIAIGEVPITAMGSGGTEKSIIAATVTFGLGPSPVFNYTYFINNFGWLYGGGITVNGDVRSNGNFAFRGNPEVNGDIYASLNPELGTLGEITGNVRNLDLAHYANQSPDRARPMNPTDPSNPEETAYIGGYNGQSSLYAAQTPLEMPYLGDLQNYKNLAQLENGKITQVDQDTGQTITLVNNVYSGEGPDGVAGTPDDGCLVIVGTEQNPITISGPVVIDSDVIIKGVVQGQGTIYSGRNIHVAGNITYKNGPSWTKPDPTPEVTAASNITKDFLGLACKGNIVLGDYTKNDWQRNVGRYLKPPFTQGYEIDPSDAAIGYDTDPDPDSYYFNGDYTANDGGQKNDGSQRKYYESSLADNFIKNIADPSNQIRQVDAVTYNNHAWTGRVGSFTLNGSIISRDEAIIYSGSIFMNYDIRANGSGLEYIDIYLPRDLSMPQTQIITKLKKEEQ